MYIFLFAGKFHNKDGRSNNEATCYNSSVKSIVLTF